MVVFLCPDIIPGSNLILKKKSKEEKFSVKYFGFSIRARILTNYVMRPLRTYVSPREV